MCWYISIFVEIPKKSGTKKCEEHRKIALIPHAMKILCKTMYNRISTKIHRQLDTLQFGFRPKVGTVESTTALKTILNNRINYGKSTYLCFIDFTKAFDRVEHKMFIEVLKKKEVKQAEICLICEIYNKRRAFMQKDSERENEIKIKRGVRQRCILSPILFNIYAEEAFRSCKIKNGIEIYDKKKINKISYADDTVIMAESVKELNDTLNKLKSNLQKWSIEINPKKTKCMVVTDNKTRKIDIQNSYTSQYFSVLGNMDK